MQWIAYGAGWLFFGVGAKFVSSIIFLPFIPLVMAVNWTAYVVGFLSMAVFWLPLFARIAVWIKEGKMSVPETLSEGRYTTLVWASGISALAIAATAVLALLAGSSGGMSGVPAGMVIMGAAVFGFPAILMTEVDDWRKRFSRKE